MEKDKNSILANELVNLLSNVASKALLLNPEDQFVRFTINHRLLTELQVKIHQREQSIDRVTQDELFVLKRASIFVWAGLKASLNFYRWTRKTSIIELSRQGFIAAKSNSLLVALSSMRSILEITGNASLLKRDLEKFEDPIDNLEEKTKWLNNFDGLIDSRISGVRSNYSKILSGGLRNAKKIAYKPGEFEANLEAKDLLNGVDLLAERVKGARAAYDFFSEFAHPNLASSLVSYDQTSVRYSINEIIFYSVQYQQNKLGDTFLDNFGLVLVEAIEIISECLDEMLKIDEFLMQRADEVALVAKRVIRDMVKRDPFAFDAHESCPCYSGKNIQNCCGRLINVSKFGHWPMLKKSNDSRLH